MTPPCPFTLDGHHLTLQSASLNIRWTFDPDHRSAACRIPAFHPAPSPIPAPRWRCGIPALSGLKPVFHPASLSAAPHFSLHLPFEDGPVQAWNLVCFPDFPGFQFQALLRNPSRHLPSARDTPRAGLEDDAAVGAASTPPGLLPADTQMAFAWQRSHLRLEDIDLRDRSDRESDLLQSTHWLPGNSLASFSASSPYLRLEDPLSGDGLLLLHHGIREPASRMVYEGEGRRIRFIETGPDQLSFQRPWTLMATREGSCGARETLHQFQRLHRNPDSAPRASFIVNTWGDRSKTGRISDAFIRKEIVAATALGADALQIDDGWQRGQTDQKLLAQEPPPPLSTDLNSFWTVDEHKFPHDLSPLIREANSHGLDIGLWFSPDNSNDFTRLGHDLQRLLDLQQRYRLRYLKLDLLRLRNPGALDRLDSFLNALRTESQGCLRMDLDMTAECRPGYLTLPGIDYFFVQNRYTDWHRYWPHLTLRVLWQLSHCIDPSRLRMEFLNPERNQALYGDDPLAPACYSPQALFATVMAGSPLGWFEASNLSPNVLEEIQPLVEIWKQQRDAFHQGFVHPVGAAPDGIHSTGFVTRDPNRNSGYILLYSPLHPQADDRIALPRGFPHSAACHRLAGEGHIQFRDHQVILQLPSPLSFYFGQWECE